MAKLRPLSAISTHGAYFVLFQFSASKHDGRHPGKSPDPAMLATYTAKMITIDRVRRRLPVDATVLDALIGCSTPTSPGPTLIRTQIMPDTTKLIDRVA